MCSFSLVQMTSQPEELLSIDHYVKKTFFKTASLMANSCKAVAILGGQPREDCQLAWEYGRHLGLAFQVGIAPICSLPSACYTLCSLNHKAVQNSLTLITWKYYVVKVQPGHVCAVH